MITLRDKLTENPGLQYVVDALPVVSAAGRRALLDTPFLTDALSVNSEYDRIQRVMELLSVTENLHTFNEIRHSLMCLHDSQGTLSNLLQHSVVDEVELFEMKNLAYSAIAVSRHASALGLSREFSLPDLSDVFDLLDPDRTGLPHFYIYDSYHPELPELRQQMKQLQAQSDNPDTAAQYAACFDRHSTIQHEVEARLSQQLWPHAQMLDEALKCLCHIDILIAKADLAIEWNLVRPVINDDGHIAYSDLFNPRLMHHNQEQRLRYQPVSVELHHGLSLVTGANMAGKTVLLKTIATAQLLAQFALFVPAREASLSLVDDVLVSVGDEQNEMQGLSSFASEIINISNIVELSREKCLMILIDEPARTTNPVEGKAIVQALGDILCTRNSYSMITTHYSALGLDCRRLRIAGFREDMADAPLSPRTINLFMDYSVVEDNTDEVPQEALRIARLLNCSDDLVSRAVEHLGDKN